MKNLRMRQEMTDRGRLEIRVNAESGAACFRGAGDGFVYGRSAECDRSADFHSRTAERETLDLATPPLEYDGTECESAVFRIYGESGGGRVWNRLK